MLPDIKRCKKDRSYDNEVGEICGVVRDFVFSKGLPLYDDSHHKSRTGLGTIWSIRLIVKFVSRVSYPSFMSDEKKFDLCVIIGRSYLGNKRIC